MFPLGDDRIVNAKPALVCWLLIVLNTIVFVYESSMTQNQLEAFIATYGTIPTAIVHGQDILTLFTSMFMHGGWMHLIGNMLFLWVFGDNIETVLGHAGFFVFYLLGGLAASAGHILSNPDSVVPSLGASGAISAVLGAYTVMFPRARVKVLIPFGFIGIARVPAFLFLGIWAFQQFLNGFASLGAETVQTEGIAWFAHIGGFVFGLLIGVLFRGRTTQIEFYNDEYNRPRLPY